MFRIEFTTADRKPQARFSYYGKLQLRCRYLSETNDRKHFKYDNVISKSEDFCVWSDFRFHLGCVSHRSEKERTREC